MPLCPVVFRPFRALDLLDGCTQGDGNTRFSSRCLALGYHLLPFQGRIQIAHHKSRLRIFRFMFQRSPVIFWLLLAATLAVYAVVISWVASEPYPTPPFAMAAFDALTFGQLSLVCIWSALRPTKSLWSYLAPFLAVIVAAFVAAMVIQDPAAFWSQFSLYLFYYGLCAGVLLLVLWFLRRTTFWKRRTNSSEIWQFSMAELLIVMTAVAVLATVARQTPFLAGGVWIGFAVTGSFVSLTLANVLSWSLSIHWLARLSLAMGAAILLGILLAIAIDFPPIVTQMMGADLLIQSVLISIWLGNSEIIPARATSNVDEPTSTIP